MRHGAATKAARRARALDGRSSPQRALAEVCPAVAFDLAQEPLLRIRNQKTPRGGWPRRKVVTPAFVAPTDLKGDTAVARVGV